MRKPILNLLLVPALLSASLAPAFAHGSGRQAPPNWRDRDFHRQIVDLEIRRASRPGYYAEDGDDAAAKRGSGDGFDAYTPRTSESDAVRGSESRPTASLNGAEVGQKGLPTKTVPDPEAKAAGQNGEKGFLAKTGDAVGGFFKGTWNFIKTHKTMTGGAVAGAVIGGLFGGPFGAILGFFIGGFGGWWVGEGLG